MSSDILGKLVAADIIIWSFGLYFYGVPGNMKNLIDRQLPLFLPFMAEGSESGGHPPRYDLSRQRHVVISTCGFWTAKGNYDSVTAMFNSCYGMGNYETIFCGQGGLFRAPVADGYLDIVRRAGSEFASGGIRRETQEELLKPIYPRDVFEKGADASWGIEK